MNDEPLTVDSSNTLIDVKGVSFEYICNTCNASHDNTVERVIRCGICVVTPDGNSGWTPMPNNQQTKGM